MHAPRGANSAPEDGLVLHRYNSKPPLQRSMSSHCRGLVNGPPCPRCPIFVDPIHQLLLSNQGSASLHPLVQSGICTALSSGLHRFICLHGFIRWSSHWFVHHPRDSTVHIKDIHSTVVDVLAEVMPYSLLQFRLVHLHTPIELHILFLEYLYSNASTSKFSLF
jgi:hypothetical protein